MATTLDDLQYVGQDDGRAMKAYWRGADPWLDQPSPGEIYRLNGREYVRLGNIRGTLAVFRVRKDGRLRRLEHWPAVLDEV